MLCWSIARSSTVWPSGPVAWIYNLDGFEKEFLQIANFKLLQMAGSFSTVSNPIQTYRSKYYNTT